MHDNLEILGIDVLSRPCNHRFLLYYRPPGLDDSDFLYASRSIECLQLLCSVNFCTHILGDFNLPAFNWATWTTPSNCIYTCFRDFFCDFGFHQIIDQPTRGNNILDIFLSVDPSILSHIEMLPPIAASDHSTAYLTLTLQVLPSTPTSYIYHDFKRGNYIELERYLKTVDWDTIFQHCFSVDQSWKSFLTILHYARDLFIPCIKKTSHDAKPTRDKHNRFLSKAKLKLWRKWKMTHSDHDLQQYRAAARHLRSYIYKRRRNLEERLLEKQNLTSFYRHVSKQLFAKEGIKSIVDSSGTAVTDPLKMANILNDYFASVFSIDNSNTNSPLVDLIPPPTLSNIEITPSHVHNILRRLKPTCSCGPDGIPNILLKNCASALAIPLCHIFDSSLKDGVLPADWKVARVTPIHKKGPTKLPSNYRPLSMTSTICRVLERTINDQMLSFLTTHNKIDSRQHGFIKKKSTVTNLIECTYDWAHTLQAHGYSDVIYFDFQKAFDTIPHSKLLHKLKKLGIAGDLLSWIRNFLSDRLQYVELQNTFRSSTHMVTSGVPQGSVLGPTLFLLFINDIFTYITSPNIKMTLYADDLKIYNFPIANDSGLQKAIDDLNKWSIDWNLLFSPTKCFVCSIHSSRTTAASHSHIPEYSLADTTLPSHPFTRDLGIIIDSNLSFARHIDNITHRASTISYLIHKIFMSGDSNLLKRAFCTYVRPILEYGSPIWNPHQKYLITCIERVQKRFTKRIPSLAKLTYTERLRILGLPSLENRRLIIDLCLYYKIFHGLVNTDISQHIIIAPVTTTRGHAYKTRAELCSTDKTKYHFINRTVNTWNSLPDHIVYSPTFHSFHASVCKFDFSSRLLFH